MRINKRYLVGFGVFAVTAGLYGVVTFRSYTQMQAGASPFTSVPATAPALAPATDPSISASPNATVSDSATAQFVGPLPENQMGLANKNNDVGQEGAQKPTQDHTKTSGQPQAQMAIPELKDETSQIPAGEVFGPADPSILHKANVQAAIPKVKVAPVADEVASDFDVIASADQALNEETQPDTRESWLKSLGISMKQYRVIQQREERLTKEVKEVEKDGADASKELLITEYKEWLREYLGQDRYVRFNELAAK